jgi:hypothetical protein
VYQEQFIVFYARLETMIESNSYLPRDERPLGLVLDDKKTLAGNMGAGDWHTVAQAETDMLRFDDPNDIFFKETAAGGYRRFDAPHRALIRARYREAKLAIMALGPLSGFNLDS